MPEIGRFIEEDPHNGMVEIPKTLNSKYIYVLNRPVKFNDPSGEIVPFLAAVAGAAIKGALIGAAVGFVTGLVSSNGDITAALSIAGEFAVLGGSISAGVFVGGQVAALGKFGFWSTMATKAFFGGLGGGIVTDKPITRTVK